MSLLHPYSTHYLQLSLPTTITVGHMQYLLLYKAYFHVSNFPNIQYINLHSIYKNHNEMDTHYSYIV
nr:MAG TPA: hypothetical protein [Bacteriophage sp.]